MTANFTDKLRLALAIRFFTVTASGASLACVGSINGDYGNASKFRLVFNEGSELKECPIRMLGSLAFSKRSPLANAFEIFDGDGSIRVFSFRDKFFADLMIYVFLIAALFTTKFS